jgi:mRNA interferase RelE/StbE
MPITLNENKVIFSKSFWKDMSKIDQKNQKFILAKLREILRGYTPADMKRLQNYPDADYRLRIGDYRLFFVHEKKPEKIYFVHCYNRRELY